MCFWRCISVLFFLCYAGVFLNQRLINHLLYLLECKGCIIYIAPVSYKPSKSQRETRGLAINEFKKTLTSAGRWAQYNFPYLFALHRWPTSKEIEVAQDKGKLSRFNPSSSNQPAAGDLFFINDVSVLEEEEKIQLLKLLEVINMTPKKFLELRSEVNAGFFFHKSSMWKSGNPASKKIVLQEVCLLEMISFFI